MDYLNEFFKFIYDRGHDAVIANNTNNNLTNNEVLGVNIEKIMKIMLDTISHMPLLSSLREMMTAYYMVLIISLSCISCIFAYKGIKMLFSLDEIDRLEGKQIFSRLVYSLILGILSLKYIDALIIFNNLIISFMISKLSIMPTISNIDNSYGIILPIFLLLIELGILIKILIGFWMRMAELIFAGIISPIMFTLWINNEWSGFLKSWNKRIIVLIFTQSTQVLLLIIYTLMLNEWMLSGTLNGICLSVAALFSLDRAPKVLQTFADNSAYADAKRTMTKVWQSKPIKMLRNK